MFTGPEYLSVGLLGAWTLPTNPQCNCWVMQHDCYPRSPLTFCQGPHSAPSHQGCCPGPHTELGHHLTSGSGSSSLSLAPALGQMCDEAVGKGGLMFAEPQPSNPKLRAEGVWVEEEP